MLRKGILGIRQSTIVTAHLPCRIRLLSTLANPTEAEEKKSSSSTTFPTNPRMVFVRPWEALPTMAHVFGIVRDIEKKFGRIDDIIVPRDPDIPTNYNPYFIVKFAWEEDAQAIPSEGKVIQVPAPDVSEYRPGGIGLSDLEPYLDGAFRLKNLHLKDEDPEAVFANPDDPKVKLMDVKLERARLRRAPPILEYSPKHRKRKPLADKSSDEAQKLALAIVNFGGFTNPALPPNAPPSSFARVVESWYNVMTPETRSNLLNRGQAPQSADQIEPQNSDIHSEIDATPFSSEADLNDLNDTIQESNDELTPIPESASTMRSLSISDIEPSIPTSTSPSLTSSSNVQSRITPDSASSTSLSSEYSSQNTLKSVRLEGNGDYNTSLVPPVDSNSMKPASETQTQSPSTLSTSSHPQISKMSKRERMLLAVREAGKADAMRTKMQQEAPKPASHPTDNAPPTLDKPDNEALHKSANWWSFLLGNDKAKR